MVCAFRWQAPLHVQHMGNLVHIVDKRLLLACEGGDYSLREIIVDLIVAGNRYISD